MLVSLKDILPKAANNQYAIAGFNIFSIDWARACVKAATELDQPVILMTNKAMVDHYKISWLGQILSDIAKEASVPVCIHLDHTKDFNIIEAAVKSGYSSIMYDGSYLSLEENIRNTKQMVKLAHDHGCSIEGEVGSVAYIDVPETVTEYTTAAEAKQFAEETNVDALAVSIGTTHRAVKKNAIINYKLLQEIENSIDIPLVIHGTSGVKDNDIVQLKTTQVAKFNIGTSLRLAYADKMREILTTSKIFDRLQLDGKAYEAVKITAKKVMIQLGENA